MEEINEVKFTGFIQKIVEDDINNKVYERQICTRFPPEPNGHLHIGSAYAINISKTISDKYNGKFNLRFDDTNPLKESIDFVTSIIEDIKWLGVDLGDNIFYGSDYFTQIYDFAVDLIKKGKAYVCDLSPTEMREMRGTLTSKGTNCTYRDRSIEENIKLFEKMKNGEFENGEKVLRAKIDMQSPNMNMRDPVIYRILKTHHYRTKDAWCIYPMYDFAHPLQDALEGITHSLCSVEFKDHRVLYEWVLNELNFVNPPKQREFGRMNITGAITSKRYLRELVEGGHVDGWDDPRLPTIKGLRRRGYTPESLKKFLDEIGVSKDESTIDSSMLEHFLRDDLKGKTYSKMAILDPIKVIITNYEGLSETLEVANNMDNEHMGTRHITFSDEIYIEREDFMEEPIKGYNRLFVGNEVRLKGAYFIKCNNAIKDENGIVKELHCTYDKATKSGSGFTGRKVKGTIHFVDAKNYVDAEVRVYTDLIEDILALKDDKKTWENKINKQSLTVYKNAKLEASLKGSLAEDRFQFIRSGYFVVDNKDKNKDKLILNRIVPLKGSFKVVASISTGGRNKK
jgi:glutaminyl-tRNA synthetase